MTLQAPVTTFDDVARAERSRPRRAAYPDIGLRLHRSISWGRRAAKEIAEPSDYDSAFVFLWISFNAAYARIRPRDTQTPERESLAQYFTEGLQLDASQRIHTVLWNSFTRDIRVLLGNQYIFSGFWAQHNAQGSGNWQSRFARESERAFEALRRRDSLEVLTTLFDRLYVLRNQLIHGGATWNGRVNRRQVRDGARIMAMLVPHFLTVMLENPHADWGKPPYPVVA